MLITWLLHPIPLESGFAIADFTLSLAKWMEGGPSTILHWKTRAALVLEGPWQFVCDQLLPRMSWLSDKLNHYLLNLMCNKITHQTGHKKKSWTCLNHCGMSCMWMLLILLLNSCIQLGDSQSGFSKNKRSHNDCGTTVGFNDMLIMISPGNRKNNKSSANSLQLPGVYLADKKNSHRASMNDRERSKCIIQGLYWFWNVISPTSPTTIVGPSHLWAVKGIPKISHAWLIKSQIYTHLHMLL